MARVRTLMIGLAILMGSSVACAGRSTAHSTPTPAATPFLVTPVPTKPTNWAVRDIGKPGIPHPAVIEMVLIRNTQERIGAKRARLLRFAYPAYGFVLYDGDWPDAVGHENNKSQFSIDLVDCRHGLMYWPGDNTTGTIPYEGITLKQFLHSWRCPGY